MNDIMGTYIQAWFTKGFSGMRKSLEAMGYQTGLTLYGAPYDWRKTAPANGIKNSLIELLLYADLDAGQKISSKNCP